MNFLPKVFSVGISLLICLSVLQIPTQTKNPKKVDMCFSATYSLVTDYSQENLPLKLMKKISKVAGQNRLIYKIIQSPTHSFEKVDSIAHICGGSSIGVEPKEIIRRAGREAIYLLYSTKKDKKCFVVQEPKYLDAWKITGPVSYQGTDDRYFKATQENTTDYVIFNPNLPVPYNLKLIRNIPGLVVEANIGMQRMKLIEFKALPCAELTDRIEDFETVEKAKVKRVDDVDFRDFMNPLTDQIRSDDFQCVQSF